MTCLGFIEKKAVRKGLAGRVTIEYHIPKDNTFPCVSVLEHEAKVKEVVLEGTKHYNHRLKAHRGRVKKVFCELIRWGELEQRNNNIYRKSSDELNTDWIEKLENKLKEFGLIGKEPPCFREEDLEGVKILKDLFDERKEKDKVKE